VVDGEPLALVGLDAATAALVAFAVGPAPEAPDVELLPHPARTVVATDIVATIAATRRRWSIRFLLSV
jgi:hypothetical protein